MIKVLNRPAIIDKSNNLDTEFDSVRWVYNRLLDFEYQHQAVLDTAAEQAAPNIIRVGTLISRLNARKRRTERSNDKTLGHHPGILKTLKDRLVTLRKERDKSDLWKSAKKWDQEPATQDELELFSISEKKVRRQASETEEKFLERQSKIQLRSRREFHELKLYKDIRCHYDSFTAAKNSIQQAKKKILQIRKEGRSAKFNRPRWSDRQSLTWQVSGGEKNQKKVLDGYVAGISIVRDNLWWSITVPIGSKKFGNNNSVTFRIKGGNWHQIPEDAKVSIIQLTKIRVGNSWKYTASITIDGSFEKKELATAGSIGIDWGHREISKTIRAFTWTDQDGKSDEIILPEKVREFLDLKDQIKSDLDKAFLVRKAAKQLQFRNRFQYRNYLLRLGVRTEEEVDWLTWEIKQDRRVTRLNQKINNIRNDLYTKKVLELRKKYSTFFVENISGEKFRELGKDQMSLHRSRQNRDVVARYKFNAIAKHYDANIVEVAAKNSTRECPDCGTLADPTKEIMILCLGCGNIRDRDHGASKVILRRGLTGIASGLVAAET